MRDERTQPLRQPPEEHRRGTGAEPERQRRWLLRMRVMGSMQFAPDRRQRMKQPAMEGIFNEAEGEGAAGDTRERYVPCATRARSKDARDERAPDVRDICHE